MEHRAIWNYRTAQIGGIRAPFDSVLKLIVKDEKSHLVDRPLNTQHPVVQNWIQRDRDVFMTKIRARYNNLDLLRSSEFWEDYYGNGLRA
jgi:hypothetical protein